MKKPIWISNIIFLVVCVWDETLAYIVVQIDRNTSKQWTILAIKRLQSWTLSSYLPPYFTCEFEILSNEMANEKAMKNKRDIFLRKKKYLHNTWSHFILKVERVIMNEQILEMISYFLQAQKSNAKHQWLAWSSCWTYYFAHAKIALSSLQNKNKKEVMHNIKWNDFCLTQLLSIVGAHRQYSRMFHSLGRFQNHLSDNSNLSIFCVLTRHFFFSLVLHLSRFFYALL